MGLFVMVVLAVIAIALILAITSEARELLDYYDNCYNGVLILMVLPACCSFLRPE